MNVNKVITDDLTKANLLNNFFVSQSTLDESKAQLLRNPPHSQYTINPKIITHLDVYTILVELDVSKVTGPDQISNQLQFPFQNPFVNYLISLLVLVSSLIFGNLLMLSPYLRKEILSIVITITPFPYCVAFLKYLRS